MADKMMDRVSKLLNQAERAPEGSPEREAFMERAMTLSAAHNIDMAIARANTVKKERVEVPEKRSFKVGQPGHKASKNAHFVDLMLGICETNDIECTIASSNTYVFGIGMPSDLDLAERLFTLLAPQMIAEADAGLKRGDNGEWVDDAPKTRRVEIPEDERAWGEHDGSEGYGESCYYDEQDERIYDGFRIRDWREVKSYPPPRFRNEPLTDEDGQPVYERKWVSREDGRIWRVNFYQGFVSRTRSRLREARKQALRDAGIDTHDDSDSRAVALRDKAKEVREMFEEENAYVLSTGRIYGGAQVSSYAHGGQVAGQEAGSRAVLGNEKDLK